MENNLIGIEGFTGNSKLIRQVLNLLKVLRYYLTTFRKGGQGFAHMHNMCTRWGGIHGSKLSLDFIRSETRDLERHNLRGKRGYEGTSNKLILPLEVGTSS